MPKKLAYISWSSANSRSDSLAHHLGIRCHNLHYSRTKRQRYLRAPFIYALAAGKTWDILWKERPEVVLVTNPPPFAGLIAWLFCRLSGGRFAIDHHSAAFNLRRWKSFSWLTRFLARRAAVNVFHSEPMARLVSGWGVRTMVLGDIPLHLETNQVFHTHGDFSLVFPCTYAEDEPIQVISEAARQLPEVSFYLTGDASRAPEDFASQLPPNVILTGYLPHGDYVALLKACQGVIALTTRDLTVQNSAYEAVELGKPLITSDWPVLKDAYPLGAIYIDNTPASLVQAVQRLQAEYPRFCSEIQMLREKIHAEWSARLAGFLQMVE